MKAKLVDLTKKQLKEINLPKQFDEQIRPDLIKRAVQAIEANQRQPYGADPSAGLRHSSDTSKRRRHYRGTYGIGISRVPRKVMSRSGTRFNFVGATAPGIVGGRRAHPPTADKNWSKKINTRENKKAIRSALAATISKEVVEQRGHKIPSDYPFIITSKLEEIRKTSEVEKLLSKLGFDSELERTKQKKVRAGRGKSRGRKYKLKTGVLFVVSQSCDLVKSASNILGVDVVSIDKINAKLLAPGAQPGRATLFSELAIEKLEKENLFFDKKRELKSKNKEKKEIVSETKEKQSKDMIDTKTLTKKSKSKKSTKKPRKAKKVEKKSVKKEKSVKKSIKKSKKSTAKKPAKKSAVKETTKKTETIRKATNKAGSKSEK